MIHNEPNQDVLIDRLVDGGLSGDERRRLLESLDRRPDGWRRCALAFLEAQTWREEFGLVAGERPSVERPVKQSAALAARTGAKSSDAMQWLAIAALVMLAFGIGWLQHGGGTRIATTPSNGNSKFASALPAPINPADALTLFARDKSGHTQSFQVPLVDANTLDQQYGVQFQTGLPESVRQQLEHQGYQVQSHQKYAPLWLENGRPMIVPVEDTRIVPAGL
jgi:hypothetical protein